jgi:integrase
MADKPTGIKGIHRVPRTLADGTVQIYTYDGKCGPRIHGEEGSDEWLANLGELRARKIAAPSGTLSSILTKFEDTAEFDALAKRTKRDYRDKIERYIEPELGDFPLKALAPRTLAEARGEFKAWRDKIAKRSKRQADYAWVVLARVCAVALDRGWIKANPCEKGGRLYHGTRADIIWTPEQEAIWLDGASQVLCEMYIGAVWTGQRQGDLRALKGFNYDGSHIRLVQHKTIRLGNMQKARRVSIPVGAPLKAILDARPRRPDEPLFPNSNGDLWTENGLQSSWGKTSDALGIEGVTFNDLRGTAVTRLALVGCTEAEIASITGHTIGQVRSILDAHYLHRHPQLAENAIRKLEERTFLPNAFPNDPLRLIERG